LFQVYTPSLALVTLCFVFFEKKLRSPIFRARFLPSPLQKTQHNMAKHLNEWYTEGLLQQKPEAVRSIFSEFLPPVAAFVRANSGTDEDAKDVFMYALEVVYRKLLAGDLTLTALFSTYLQAICRRHWLKSLRRNKYDAGVTPDDLVVSNTMGKEQETEFSENKERQALFSEKFKKIAEDCQMVLTLSWTTEMSMEEIAESMGWTYAYARKRKTLCKQSLIEAVQSDPRYAELRA